MNYRFNIYLLLHLCALMHISLLYCTEQAVESGFIEAAKKGDLSTLQQLKGSLRKNAYGQLITKPVDRALVAAAEEGQLTSINYLLSLDPQDTLLAIHRAIEHKNDECSTLLIRHFISVNEQKDISLELAELVNDTARYGRYETLAQLISICKTKKPLLDFGESLFFPHSGFSHNALQHAILADTVEEEDKKSFEMLCAAGANTNTHEIGDNHSRSLLSLLIHKQKASAIKFLLPYLTESDLNAPDACYECDDHPKHGKPIYCLIAPAHYERGVFSALLGELIKKGMIIRTQNTAGDSPLQMVFSQRYISGALKTAKVLLKHGADPEDLMKPNSRGLTPAQRIEEEYKTMPELLTQSLNKLKELYNRHSKQFQPLPLTN